VQLCVIFYLERKKTIMMMSNSIEYVYPIGYVEPRELIFDENEEYESGDCYSGDEEEYDDDYLFQNSSALKDLPILFQLKVYYTKLSAGLHGRYTNSYVYDKTKPHLLGQKLKLWVKDKSFNNSENPVELYFIAESTDLNMPTWRGYDYSNDYTLTKYTQEENIEKSTELSTEQERKIISNMLKHDWKDLQNVNVKLRINNIGDLLKRIKEHYVIRKQLKLDAAKSHIKLDMQKLKKDKLYTIIKFPYVDIITKKKKTVDYQIIKIWKLDETGTKYVHMYYVMSGTSDKLYGRWIGMKVEDQKKTINPINKEDEVKIKKDIIDKFEELKIKKDDMSISIIPSGINNLIKKIAEHYFSVTH